MISIFRKDEGSSITYQRCIIKMRRPASARGSSSTKWKQNVWKHQEEQRPKFHGMKLVSMINFESASWIMQCGNAQTRSTLTTTVQRNHHPISIISQTAKKKKKHPKAKKCHHFWSTKKNAFKKNHPSYYTHLAWQFRRSFFKICFPQKMHVFLKQPQAIY